MSNKLKLIEIRNPLPTKEQETAITRLRGEGWRITTSEPAFARKLQRRGYTPLEDDGADGHSLSFEISDRCLTVRSRSAVENPHQTANLPNGPTIAAGSTPEPPNVGKEPGRKREIEEVDASSAPLLLAAPKTGPKPRKGEELTRYGSEAPAMARVPHLSRGLS